MTTSTTSTSPAAGALRTYNGQSIISTKDCARRSVDGITFLVRPGAHGFLLAWVLREIAAGGIESARTIYGHRSREQNTRAGGSPRSDHMSGCAVDYNGALHPWEARGGKWSSGWSSTKIRAVRVLLAYTRGTVKWGLDYARGQRDAMHFYTSGKASTVTAAARRLRSGTATVTGNGLAGRTRPSTKTGAVIRRRNAGARIPYDRVIYREGRVWLRGTDDLFYAAEYTSVHP